MTEVDRTDDETLFVERHRGDRYAVVSLHRPGTLNAADPTLLRELTEMMAGFEGDDDVRAVVLTGGDAQAFSAGVDLGDMTVDDPAASAEFLRTCLATFRTIEALPKPVVAAVNGYAFGFGLEVALACDLVIASDRARFSLREMDHGLVPAVTLTRGLDVMGRRRVAWLAMTSEDITAETAREAGLVNEVVAHQDLAAHARALAGRLARRAPLAMAATKRLLNADAEAHYRASGDVLPAILASRDVAEGRRAFEEKREPVFEGR